MDGRYRTVSNGINSVDESLFGSGTRKTSGPKTWVDKYRADIINDITVIINDMTATAFGVLNSYYFER